MSALQDWLSKQGGFLKDCLEIRTQPNGYRGVYTRTAIPKGELLLRIPDACVIQFQPDATQFSPPIELMVRLMQEKRKDKDSAFSPYLQSLPEDFNLLLDWSPAEIDNLEGTYLYTTAKEDQGGKLLLKNYANNVAPKLSEQFTDAEFLFAAKAVTSRSFSVQEGGNGSNDGPFLIPYVDLLNHSESCSCTSIKRDPHTKSFFMESERSIAAGEELFHKYGQGLTNSQTLQTYGFVAEDGEITPATFLIGDVICHCEREALCPPESVEWNPLANWRDKVELCVDRLPPALPCSLENLVSKELLTLLCVLFMPRESFIDYVEKPFMFEPNTLEDDSMWTIIYCTLFSYVEEELKGYGEPPQTAFRRLKAAKENSRTQLALTVKAEELRTLIALKMLAYEELAKLDVSDSECSDFEAASISDAKRQRVA